MNGLEALKKLPKWLDDEHRDSEEEYFKESEEYKTIERELKAFEIIKKDPQRALLISNYKDYNEYINDKNPYYIEKELMKKDEFNLLKEVMKC